jgi:hypothetical protein
MELQQGGTAVAEPSDADVHARLLEAAEAADRGEGPSALEALPSAKQDNEGGGENKSGDRATDDNAESNKVPNPEASAENPEGETGNAQDRDDNGRFKKKGEQPNNQQDGESKFRRAKREQERLEKTWQGVNQRKTDLDAREQELLRREQEIQQARQQRERQQAPEARKSARFGSREYMSAADDFEKLAQKALQDQDLEKAQENFQLASKTRAHAIKVAEEEYAEWHQSEQGRFDQSWEQNAKQVVKDNPELADATSEVGKAVQKMLNENPVLGLVADGFRSAYEAVKLQREAAAASGLREELKKAKDEVARLNKLVSPQGGKNASGHSASTSQNFANMSEEEQRAYLLSKAESADASR